MDQCQQSGGHFTVGVGTAGGGKPNDVDLIVSEKQGRVLDAIAAYNDCVDAANTLFPHEPPRVRFRLELDRHCETCGQRF